MRLKAIRSLRCVRWFAWLLSYAIIFSGVSPAWAQVCNLSDLADVPLELLNNTAKVPSIFMISLDNSATMDYGVMTNEASENKTFTAPLSGTVYGYVLHGDNANGDTPLEDTVDKYAWKSQYCGTNKMYYNPTVTYNPWPGRPDSDVDTPRWDPRTPAGDGEGTYDLTANFGADQPTIAYTPVMPLHATVNQEQNGDTWVEVATVTAEANGTARIQVDATVTSANSGSGSDEFFAGPLKFVDQTTPARKAGPDVTMPAPTKISPTTADCPNCWVNQDTGSAANGGPYHGKLTDTTGNFTAIWKAEGSYQLVAGHTYSVYSMWHAYTERSDAIQYKAMEQTNGPPITIKRRHFYMISTVDNSPYLIEEGASASPTVNFYKVDESKGEVLDQLDNPDELVSVTFANLPADIRAVLDKDNDGSFDAAFQKQNFANWVTYHSRRMWAAVNAVAIMISEMHNMLVGMQTSPPSAQQGKTGTLWINTNFNGHYYDMTAEFYAVLYNIPAPHSNRGFSADLTDMGDFVESVGGSIANNNDKAIYTNTPPVGDPDRTALGPYATASANGTYPYFTENYGGSCQQAFALVITDGASPSTANIANYDGDNNTLYDGGIFGDTYRKTAADAGMQYYERDLKPGLSDNVPTNYIDLARFQHMVTYGLSFGVQGPLRQADPTFNALCAQNPPANTCASGCNCPTWTDPLNGGSVLDDLFHATVNARGLFMYADNPEELIAQLRLIQADIERRTGGAASVTTNSVQRQYGTKVYQGLYDSTDWWGDVVAKNIDVTTGAISNNVWSARDQLETKAAADRKIFTSDGSNAVDFTSANAASFGLTANQVDYLRGDATNEEPNGAFRARTYEDDNHVVHHFKLGDIAHSEPFYYKNVVYIGANDGMLHAFDGDTGNELFAYIPSQVIPNLWRITDPGFVDNHKFFVDASPYVYSFGTSGTQYLACGLGKGGKGIFCLKVEKARNAGVTKDDVFNWEYSDPSDTSLGYVYGKAYVVQTTAGTVVIFGNGYLSNSFNAVLYVKSAADGSEVHTFDTGYDQANGHGCNGMSSPALIDYDSDGIIDYVYAGDLDGNLWKFDLRDNDPNNWSIAYGGHPLFTARDESGNVQPITDEPDAMKHCDTFRAGVIVVVGTGQYLGENDLGGQGGLQSVYGIYDWALDLEVAGGYNVADMWLGSFTGTTAAGGGLSHVSVPASDPATLLQQTIVEDAGNYREISNNQINYYDPFVASQTGQTNVGWYFTFTDSSERVVRRPLIIRGVAFVTSNITTSTFCSGAGGGYLYAFDACNGGRTSAPQFDVNGNGTVDSNDLVGFSGGNEVPSGMYFDTTLFDPLYMQGNLYVPDTFGNINQVKIPDNPAGMRYWRIIQ